MRDENRVISRKLFETTFKHVIAFCEGSKGDSNKIFHYVFGRNFFHPLKHYDQHQLAHYEHFTSSNSIELRYHRTSRDS